MSGDAAGWPRVKLDCVLTQFREYVAVPDAREYKKLSVKLYGKGVTLDAPVRGDSLKMQRHQIARAGQVIVSEIWGKKGAIGFVPQAGEGALCTSHFFLFDIDCSRLDRGWLQAIFTRNLLGEELDALARGTTGYAAVRPQQFLSLAIPLPPLPKQQCIVAQIDDAATKLVEAQRLQDAVAAEADELCRALLRDAPDAVLTPLRDLVTLRSPDVSVHADESYHFAGVYCFGRGVFVGNAKTGMEFAYPNLTRLRAGNFVYPKLMAWEGAFGVVPPECDGLVVSTEFPVFEVNRDRVLPEVLDVHFRNPALWSSIGGASTGTNVRRRRLNPQDFLDLRLPLPPMACQQVLAETYAEVRRIKGSQAESRMMLDALLPAILDRAFAGAL